MQTLKGPGSDVAAAELLEELRPTARRVFARYRIPLQDTEDLLQQALVSLLTRQESVRDPRAWTIGAVRNLCRLYWRNRRKILYETVDTAILESVADPARPEQEREDAARDLRRLLRELPDRCQSVLDLRYRMGCRPKEAARRLGYRDSSIYKITERCLAALSRRLMTGAAPPGRPPAPGLRRA